MPDLYSAELLILAIIATIAVALWLIIRQLSSRKSRTNASQSGRKDA